MEGNRTADGDNERDEVEAEFHTENEQSIRDEVRETLNQEAVNTVKTAARQRIEH